ncbi:MAG: glucuronate isomerase [Kiritimatiellae bacterium]|nr:glucuronate isomerase [Kiritimatiellia bacterium]
MTTFDTLYSWVRELPIIDWHNHLDLQVLAKNSPLGSLYTTWVKPDPYKHRAMRICGEPEHLITGDAPEAEKWEAWRRTLPKLVGGPLFTWARMELNFLGIDGNENVSLADWTPSKMLRRFGVEYLSPCVRASEIESLETQGSLENLGYTVAPSLRLNIGDKVPTETLEHFLAAGCRVVDISVNDVSQLTLCFDPMSAVAAFASSHDWTMLLHLGALRETSARLREAAGSAGGFAGMRAPADPAPIADFLNRLEREGILPRTILLTLNPLAHAQLAVLTGSFVEDGVPGKVQLGPAWWWCDHADGIRDVLEKQAAYGVLSTFIGMTTDSRSLLSFVRHDYFRRLLCRWVAEKVATGDFPDDESLLKPMLENVCYRNAQRMIDATGNIPVSGGATSPLPAPHESAPSPGGATSSLPTSHRSAPSPGGATSPLPTSHRSAPSPGGATSPLPAPPESAPSPGGATPPLPTSRGSATGTTGHIVRRKYPSHTSVMETSDNRAVILFVTVCVIGKGQRGRCPSLDNDMVHECIVDAWQKADTWLVGRYVIMPDHLHFFCSPATYPIVPFRQWIGYWKRLVAQTYPVGLGNEDVAPPIKHHTIFQRDQWDTQLRTGDSYSEKWEYVRNNPVRKGLVQDADNWPYQGELNGLCWHER